MIVDETLYFQRHAMKAKEAKCRGDCCNRHEDEDDATATATATATSAVDDHNQTNNICDWTVPPHILYPVQKEDHPIICQIGTIHPVWTTVATQCILHANYNVNELNINLDCPSQRVKGKEFGAVLMQDVSKVRTFVQVIQKQLPSHMVVSVKCRIGMIITDDKMDASTATKTTTTTIKTDYDWIVQFIKEISSVCQRFILHARPVMLYGLHHQNQGSRSTSSGNISPAQNRCIPPLNYTWVYRLCHEFPDCDFIINGGITDLLSAKKLCYGVADNNESLPPSMFSDDTIDQGHGVPCTKCQQLYPTAKYGSCIVPPLFPAPSNLRGCMMGRAAMDHPIQFAKVDQFWYNDNDSTLPVGKANMQKKATTRRQVLQQYCQFLDQLYPRRCCDTSDTIITSELPAPTVDYIRPFCYICKTFRQSFVASGVPNGDSAVNATLTTGTEIVNEPDPPIDGIKIATRIIDRSLKPILNIFHGCSGSKMFRHDCEALRRNTTIRNCGPAYILYHAAIQQCRISDAILDESIL
jgi:tRNA-dihydrouridine synthase A